jgi:homoserine O-acetyltransferase
MKTESIGKVKAQEFCFADSPDGFKLESGQTLSPVTLVYETYGSLNSSKTNAILVLHAFSGDSHAAGLHEGDSKSGWWDSMIGPGKALDTDKYFVICSNIIGGCQGSTGPSSLNPTTGKPYGMDFPLITVADIVNAQKHLIDHLGIDKLLSVIGGSMGGMQALQWASACPERIASAIPMATALKHSPQQIAFDEVGRQAIMADPDWRDGNYYEYGQPERGLAVARMIGHITYMSEKSMEGKFSRRLQGDWASGAKFAADFEVEGYLKYRGDNFVQRFDANSYLYLTKAMDFFDLSGGKLITSKKHLNLRFLVIGFKSDWLYPVSQLQEIVRELKIKNIDATYCEVEATYGHDSFLVETDKQTHLINHFLERIFKSLKKS